VTDSKATNISPYGNKSSTGANTSFAKREIIPVLRKVPLFESITSEQLNEFIPIIKYKKYKDRENIFTEHAVGKALYIILFGLVKIYLIAPGNKKKTLALLRKGDFFGELKPLVMSSCLKSRGVNSKKYWQEALRCLST